MEKENEYWKKIRTEAKKSIKTSAEETGRSKHFFTCLENGTYKPISQAQEILKLYGYEMIIRPIT